MHAVVNGGRRWRWALLIIALGGVAVAAVAAGRTWLRGSARDETSSQPRAAAPPAAVAPGVYLVPLSPSAVYVIDTPAGMAFVDSGLDADGATLTRTLTEWGFDLGRLRLILLTHAHIDHSSGARHFARATGAPVYAGKGDCAVLRAGGPREAFFAHYTFPGVEPHPTDVDVELTGGEVIELGGVHIHAVATPGHTPGSMCYWMERDGRRILFTGDVISSLTAELGTYTAHLPPEYRGNARDYVASLKTLRAMPAPDYILVGHPRTELVPDTRRLAPAQWRTLLDRGVHELERPAAR